MKNFKYLASNESGQGLAEYSLVISLVALAAIGAVIVFGESLLDLYEMIKINIFNAL